jgi:1-deoxy-D-xylulose-5-phosphate synthase
MDETVLRRALTESAFVITVEESTLCGGFGSAVLEVANDAGLPSDHIRRLGIPDRFIEHGERGELLADLGLDEKGFLAAAREMLERFAVSSRDAVA